MHKLKLTIDDDGPTAMRKLRHQYKQLKGRHPYDLWDRYPVLWRVVIETASLSTNLLPDLESNTQYGTRQVFVAQRKKDPEFTAAFYNPEILPNGVSFLAVSPPLLARQLRSGRGGKHVLLIGLSVNWVVILLLVMLNAVVCLGPGILVGFLTQSVGFGVGVTSAVAAVLTCLESFLVIYHN